MQYIFSFVRATVWVLLFTCTTLTVPVFAQMEQEIDTLEKQKVTLFQGDIMQLKVYGLTRIAIVEPGIFEIINATEDMILISGSMEGETSVFLWDSKGKRRFEVQVIPRDLDYIMSRIQKFLDASQIAGIKLETNDLEGKIMATGKILREKKSDFDAVMDKFGQHVINLVKEDVQLVEIDVQITELSTTISKTMGIAWPTSLSYRETLPTFRGNLGDWFRIGDFTRTAAITATVNMLISEGKGRVLSKPNVVVTSGDDATFLVGGEIPITTTTTSEGNVSQNVSYKSYGVDLTVTPEIKEDKIDITLSVSIRDLDPAHAVGDNTAFTTRSADTKLLLRDGQTIVLAGLIKENKSEAEQRVPFLSKIPVVGMLFRNKQWDPNSEIEVVISLTPRILKDRTTAMTGGNTTLDDIQQKIDRDLKAQEDETTAENEVDIFGKKMGNENTSKQRTGIAAPAQNKLLDASASTEEGIASSALAEARADAVTSSLGVAAGTTISPASSTVEDTPASASQGDLDSADASGLSAQGDDQNIENTTDFPDARITGEGNFAGVDDRETFDETAGTAALAQKEVFPQIEDVSPIITKYVQAVQQKIAQAISFPYEAKEKNLEGTTVLGLTILSDGKLNKAVVKESSGQEIFDKDAVNTAQIVAPFDAFPAEIDLQELEISVPIKYNQEVISEKGTADTKE